jgi:hypothetical protein
LRNFLILCLFLIISVFYSDVKAQDNKLIQFSGVVVTSDSLTPLPFVSIAVKNTRKGTITDYYGFFSFVAKKGDIIVFSTVGYKPVMFKIPDTITHQRYSLIQTLAADTVLLSETVIYPWPSPEQFKNAFININIPDDEYRLAEKNLARAEMKERFNNFKMDGSMNYKYAMDRVNSRLYYAGQLPPNNLLNPFAWAKFIQAWRNGDFKRKN